MDNDTVSVKDYAEITAAILDYFKALSELRRLSITPNSKDFTSQLGEWLVAEIYDGEKAKNGIQKDWDTKAKGKFIQVKTHAKSETTTARWSAIKHDPDAQIDNLVIVVFSADYKLKEFYNIPWVDALDLIRRNKDRDVIMWDHIRNYKVEFRDLPNQNVMSIFGNI